MIRVISFLILLFTTAYSEYKCFSYNPKGFFLEHRLFVDNSIENFKDANITLDNLKILFVVNRGKVKKAFLEYGIKSYKFYSQDNICEEESSWGKNSCVYDGADGGGFRFNNRFDILIDDFNLVVFRGEPDAGGIDIEKRVGSYDIKSYHRAKEITCPKEMINLVKNYRYYDRDKIPKGKYVCYDDLGDAGNRFEYWGCIRSKISCKTLSMRHFGYYLTIKESKKALKRCKSSRPNKDFIDNKNGLYVCYDYLNYQREYIGCFRAKKSCKKLHKKSFGKYSNKKEAKEAYFRCRNSLLYLKL